MNIKRALGSTLAFSTVSLLASLLVSVPFSLGFVYGHYEPEIAGPATLCGEMLLIHLAMLTVYARVRIEEHQLRTIVSCVIMCAVIFLCTLGVRVNPARVLVSVIGAAWVLVLVARHLKRVPYVVGISVALALVAVGTISLHSLQNAYWIDDF